MAYRKTERVREHLAEVRLALVRAGRDVVAEGGFRSLKVAVVAERAGLGTGTVYRHFPSKSALAVEVFAYASQRELDGMARALGREGPVLARLERAITGWCERAQRGRVLAGALLYEPVEPAVGEARLRYRSAYAERLAEVIRQGIASGELPEQDASVSATCIVGAMGESVLGTDTPPKIPAIVRFVTSALTCQGVLP